MKSSKTVSELVVSEVIVLAGRPTSQNFDWLGKPLLPGDLLDPNNDFKQDCLVNSIDLSLIEARMDACCNGAVCPGREINSSCADWDKLKVADVNYDGVVNGNDMAKAVYTITVDPEDSY